MIEIINNDILFFRGKLGRREASKLSQVSLGIQQPLGKLGEWSQSVHFSNSPISLISSVTFMYLLKTFPQRSTFVRGNPYYNSYMNNENWAQEFRTPQSLWCWVQWINAAAIRFQFRGSEIKWLSEVRFKYGLSIISEYTRESHQRLIWTVTQPKTSDLKVVVRRVLWEKLDQLGFLSSSTHHIVNILWVRSPMQMDCRCRVEQWEWFLVMKG